MKALHRMFGGAMLCLAAVAGGFGQITITTDDVAAQMAVTSFVTNRWDLKATTLNIGAPGSSSWDFSTLRNDSSMTLTSVDKATTPFASSYPGATHVLQSSIVYTGIAGKAYLYLNIGTNLTNLGINAIADASTPQFPTTLTDAFSPADVVYSLPSTLGTQWTSTYTETVDFLLLGFPALHSVTAHNYSYAVDGFGPMKMPDGNFYDALRIRRMDSTAAGKKVGYMFLAKNGASVQLWLGDVNAPDHGVVGVSLIQWSAPFNTAVAPQSESLPKEVQLLQNYPNPFNPTTVVSWQLPVAATVKLAIYDLLGREVATLVNGPMTAGNHSATWNAAGMPSGVYMYRLQVGSGTVFTKRMMLVK